MLLLLMIVVGTVGEFLVGQVGGLGVLVCLLGGRTR